MIRMTFISFLGHFVGFFVLVFLSWYQPIPKAKRGEIQRIHFPAGSGPGAGGTRVQTPGAPPKNTPPSATPKLSTPEPVKTVEARKTIERQVKKSPTPEATKSPTPTKKATTTPKAIPTTKQSPKPEKSKTATPAPSPPRKTGSPSGTPGKTPSTTLPKTSATPGKGETDGSAAPMVVSGTKQGNGSIPGIPGVPGGTGPAAPLSNFDYYRYMAQVRIEQNFTIPRHLRAAGVTCLMKFTVLRDGLITNIRLLQGTSDPILDGFAQRALETTERLSPFPDTLKEEQVELTVLFDYSLPEDNTALRE